MHVLATGEFWVLVALIIFIAIAIYMKVPGMLAGVLDKRSNEIANELDQARRLREEAQTLLASYQRRQAEAMKEADEIVVQAKAEAERLAAETRANLKALVERRQQVAEDKIAQAEKQALQEVRAVAAEIAVGAAQKLIAEKVDATKDATLVESAIGDLSKFH
ncbi:ATP F0F1 synthase subunit B [Parvibaculum sp.]|uniref:F0F1 ATP synthase subunit B family protein n=1 Tax=Parvibaculum sp. TaxID=2024848 RepID=UPI002C2BC240|nr:ATP F0F1 synthase subunit B [Parvibaculum sp.]HUD52770.1 ATP F0F1 synthase subunit B [Parvibaculum sp.]